MIANKAQDSIILNLLESLLVYTAFLADASENKSSVNSVVIM